MIDFSQVHRLVSVINYAIGCKEIQEAFNLIDFCKFIQNKDSAEQNKVGDDARTISDIATQSFNLPIVTFNMVR